MSAKKEIWRLLEPGVDIISEGDEWLYPGPVWGQVCSPFIGDKVGVHAAQHVCVVRRRMALPEPQGWISVKETMPTKEDAGHRGCVLWLFESEAMIAAPWDKDWGHEVKYSHWATIPPNSKKDSDEEAWHEWSRKNKINNVCLGNGELQEIMKHGFMAGRKSVTAEKEGGA